MVKKLRDIRDSALFQNFIILVIVAAGVVVGIQTYGDKVAHIEGTLHFLDQLILWIFVAEIVVKMGAEGSKPWKYFYDPWNVFDFAIVAVCFMPFDASFVAVLRLARILRVLKLVTALPRLQVLVGALLKSIPSMGYVSVLLLLLFYLYAAMAVFLYGPNDPVHFENLQIAMLTLFRVVTLEDWTDVMYIQMFGCDNYGYGGMEALCTNPAASPVGGALFFVSFVMLGTMVLLNLFIGIIMNGMDEAQTESEAMERAERGDEPDTVLDEIHLIEHAMDDLKDKLNALRHRIETEVDKSADA